MLHSTKKIVFCALLCCLSSKTASADNPPKSQVTPERVRSAIHKLEQLANETLRSTDVPGIAIVVVHQDRAVYKQGFGVREAGQPQPIDADTVFQLASVSKPITST